MRAALVALAAAAALAVPAAASAGTIQRSSGDVQATLTFTTSHGQRQAGRLTIVRNGTTLVDEKAGTSACQASCPIDVFKTEPSLRVRNLDADAEPEVLFTAYTGGAHCCTVSRVYDLKADASGYDRHDHFWGDPGFRLRDLDSDGVPEWFSGDDRFAYEFTAYAFSVLPVQIWRFEGGKLRNVTGSFKALVRKDAARALRIYRKVRNRSDGTQLGAVSAWAANEYRLGKRAQVLRFLRREVRHGRLRGPGLRGRRFVHRLDTFLRHAGYG